MPDKARAWAATHTGLVRSHNEDNCQVADWRSPPQHGTWHGSLAEGQLWAAVADGMGGHRRGEVASSIVVDCIAEIIETVASENDILRMLAQANMRVFQAMSGPEGRPAMGSTVAGMLVNGRAGWIFNIGDSRAYLLSSDTLQRASRDHTPHHAIAGARSHALTQSLGGTTVPVPLAPHVAKFDPDAVETVLICSDGLTDMVEDDEIEALLRRSPDDPAQALLEAALDAGGLDNITIIVVRLMH